MTVGGSVPMAIANNARELPAHGLWIGNRAACAAALRDSGWAVINTSKVMHAQLVGVPANQLRKHPNYLRLERDGLLSFNWVDGEARLYEWHKPEAFTSALDFIDRWRLERQVLVSCDQGQSRSPTLGLLYLAKRAGLISNDDFATARREFVALYPRYAPAGIGDYVSRHWAEVR